MKKKESSVKGTTVEDSVKLFGEPYRIRTTGKMRRFFCHECGNSRYGQVRYYSQKNMTNAICPKCFNEMCSNALSKTEPDNNLRQGSTIYLWQDNHKCKATSRILKKRNYMLALGSFGTPVISMYRCSGCGKKIMPQDTYDKNTIVDRYYVVVSANGEILNDRFADSFAVNRQEKIIPVKAKKPQTIVRKKPSNNKVIETTGFLTRTTIKRCSAENHTIEDIQVVVRVLDREYKITSEMVPAIYCRTCNKYYLLESDYKSLELREDREKLRAGFNDAANEVRKYFNSALNNYLNQNYRARIEEIDNQVAEIRSLRKNKSEACKKLELAQDECRRLITEIHRDYDKT